MENERGDLAIRLTEERVRLGYSQADFARKIGMSREGLRLYETGQRGMSAEFLAQTVALGVDVQYVLVGTRSTNVGGPPASAPAITIDSSSNIVGNVLAGGTVNQVSTHKHVTKTVAEVRPGDEHISQEQAAKLTELVNEIVRTEGRIKDKPATHRSVWAALNAHCKVTRYLLIPALDFDRARSYLQQWLGRLNSQPSAAVANVDAWRKRHYAYIKINTKDSGEALAAYLHKNFRATSLTDLSNEELDRVYQYVASRRRR